MPSITLSRPDLTKMIGRIAAVTEEGEGHFPRQDSVSPDPADLRVLASVIDHTMLRPQASSEEINRFCREAVALGVGAVAIHQAWVPLASRMLHGTGVKVGTVVGFPFGAALSSVKRAEAEASIRAGAEELDMVMNIGALRSGNLEAVQSDIRGVVDIAHDARCIIKVILENAYLSDEQKVAAC